FCHLYGIKPGRGRVPNAFGKPDRDVLYTCGPIARSVADAAAMLDVMAAPDAERPPSDTPPPLPLPHTHPRPPPPPPRRDRPAPPVHARYAPRAPLGGASPEIASALERAARLLGELGHPVEEGVLPEGSLEEFLPLWQHLVADIPFTAFPFAQPITRWLGEAG